MVFDVISCFGNVFIRVRIIAVSSQGIYDVR